MTRLGCCYCVIDNGSGICTLLSADHLHTGAICPLFQLAACSRAERVRSRQNDLFALGLELSRKLADRGRLSDTVYSDDHDNRLFIFKTIRSLDHVHLLFDTLDQKLLTVRRLLDMLLLHLLF